MQCCPPLLPSLQSVDLVCSDGSVRPTGRGTSDIGGYDLQAGDSIPVDTTARDCPGGYDMARSRLRRAPYERFEFFLRWVRA